MCATVVNSLVTTVRAVHSMLKKEVGTSGKAMGIRIQECMDVECFLSIFKLKSFPLNNVHLSVFPREVMNE